MIAIPITPFTIPDGEDVPLCVSLTGSWQSNWGSPMVCALIKQGGEYLLAGEMQFDSSTTAYNTTLKASQYAGTTITHLMLNLAVDTLTFSDVEVSINVVMASTHSGPVESVYGGEGLMWAVPSEVLAMEEYGLGISETCYNYVDFQKKALVVNCTRQPSGALSKCDTPYEIDLSEFVSDDDAIFPTEGCTHVYFGFSQGGEDMVLPHTIRYQVKVV
jgi:hypothetical protein